jgi:hypothetical protein
MEQIKEIVNSVIEKLVSCSGAEQQETWRAWQNAVGKKFITHTTIENYRNGRLLVRVDSPAALFQLNLKRNQILEKLQKIDKNLKSLDLKLGQV